MTSAGPGAQGDITVAVLVDEEDLGTAHSRADANCNPLVAGGRFDLEVYVSGPRTYGGLWNTPAVADIAGAGTERRGCGGSFAGV